MENKPPNMKPLRKARRDEREKRAKATINKVIPALLKSHTRARLGVEASHLIVDPVHPTNINQGNDSPRPVNVSIRTCDTLRAARDLSLASDSTSSRPHRVGILNMASPLRPGGGVLTGASSQEESLCVRTTLLQSLREEFYRLPDVGAVYTPDVLVFRSCDDDASELDRKDFFYVDAITAAMLRFPDVETEGEGESEEARYAEEKDREMVGRKMLAVMRIAREKGVGRLVLGAWGCGAYGNPVGEVARAWKRVLMGRKWASSWDGMDIVFAIKDGNMARRFSRHLGVDTENDEAEQEPGDEGEDDDSGAGGEDEQA